MSSSFYLSANMSLPIPTINVDPGPDYAANQNAAFTLIDSHNHTSGQGVPITPAGLNINADLPLNLNNLVSARSLRFTAQGSPLSAGSDLGCLYESGVDLYYNDGNGNQVRITQSGGVAGSPGSIAGLSSPASATYVSANQTFVWQSAASTPANLDAASLIVRNVTASSKGITISAPIALASDYALTLPALPASQKFMTLDASGNIAAPWAVDNSTLQVATNTVQVKDAGITRPKLAAVGQQISSSSGGFSTTSSSFVDVTNLTVTITTTGRPVMIFTTGVAAGTDSALYASHAGSTNLDFRLQILRGATVIYGTDLGMITATGSLFLSLPPSALMVLDTPTAGTYTYKVQARAISASTTVGANGVVLVAYEL